MLRSATCSTNPESSRLICESSVVNPLFEDSGGRASQGGRHVSRIKWTLVKGETVLGKHCWNSEDYLGPDEFTHAV